MAESGDWVRRMQKSLDQMNVRVHRAVSDIDGVTGMAIVRAIVDGERDARQLAKLRDPRCHKSEEEIAEQLSGHWREDHLFSLRQALKMYDAIQERITDYEKEILQKLAEMEREECRGQEVPKRTTHRRAERSRAGGRADAPGFVPDERSGSDGIDAIGWKLSRSYSANTARFEPFSHREAVRSHVTLGRTSQRAQATMKKKKRNSASTRVAAALRMALIATP